MKTKTSILFYALIMGLLVLTNSCKKDEDKDDPKSVAVLTTAEVSEITETTAVSGGDITSNGGASVIVRGVCWSTSETPTISDSKTIDGKGEGKFISNITDLESNTTYYVRAYATNSEGTGYGNATPFKTLKIKGSPVLTTTKATDITQTSVVSGGNISDDGGAEITVRGVCWGTNET